MTSFLSAFKIGEVRKKLLITLAFILIYRLGSFIPISGVDLEALQSLFANGGLLSFINLFSGGSLSRFSIFALGILPYINASIIMQMMSFISPSLKELAQEGVSGQKQIAQYTRYLTVAISVVQGFVMAFGFKSFILPDFNFTFFIIYATISLIAGSTLVMWIAELMSDHGIGNGASLLIFIGIIAEFPLYIGKTSVLIAGGTNLVGVIVMVLFLIAMIASIVYVQEAERRIKVQYAKRVVGRKMLGAQTSYIPLRLIQGGVLPIIFASALMQFPLFIVELVGFEPVKLFFDKFYSYNGFFYNLTFAILIFFFSYFYTAISFNPEELSKNIKKHGGFIVGVRPGKSTESFLEKSVSSLTLMGASFLAIVAVLPVIFANLTNVDSFQGLGGTALLILVGVALDLMRQFETYSVSVQYNQMTGR